jgi:hypothetical protein
LKVNTLSAGLAAGAVVLAALSGTATAFNPQPDPPAFGIVSINPDQTIRLNVVCWEHPVDGVPPGPCRGDLMFHDMAGNVVAIRSVQLAPGHAASLDFTLGARSSVANLVGLDPCWIPDPTSGRALPTAEVFDTVTGRTALHVNPLTPRISIITNDARARQ